MVTSFTMLVGIVAIIMVASTTVQFLKHKITAAWALFWSALWILGSAAMFFGGWLDKVSRVLIQDNARWLVIYIAIILLFYLLYRLFLMIQRMNRSISRLVEELAKKK